MAVQAKNVESYKPLQHAFRNLDTSVKAWYKHSRFPKSEITASAILNRNDRVDPNTLAYLAFCLDFSNKQIVELLDNYAAEFDCYSQEVAVLKRLIMPVDFTNSEQSLVIEFRKLDSQKRKLIIDMIEKLT